MRGRISMSLKGLSLLALLLAGAETRGADPAALAGPVGGQPVRMILDADMDSDCDDAGALGVLHALADRGEVEILAVMISALDPYSVPCAEAINTYYGRPAIPIGSARPPAPNYKSAYTKAVADRGRHSIAQSSDAPDAVELYARILAGRADASVTIVTIGDMTNLAKLLDLPATDARPSGRDLVAKKVRVWVCMGGNFIGKPAHDDLKLGNNNFTVDAPSTYKAITQWPGPIVFAGREVCSVPSGLQIGADLAQAPEDHPVRIAYEAYFKGTAKDRHVADLATVLYAVRGLRGAWDAEGPGRMDLQKDMTFTWKPDPAGSMSYLLKRTIDGKPNDRAIEAELNALLMAPPGMAGDH